MEKLRDTLKKTLTSNQITARLLPAATVFLMIYPVAQLLTRFFYLKIYYSLSALLYLLYIVGVVFSFAMSADLALGISFAMLAVSYLITMIKSFTFNQLVYTAFYAVLAFLAFRNWKIVSPDSSSKMKTATAGKIQKLDAILTKLCPECGKRIRAQSKFCPFCGSPCPDMNKEAEQGTKADKERKWHGMGKEVQSERRQSNASSWNTVADVCGSSTTLVFNIFFSAYLLLNVFADFSFLGFLYNIPMIAICVGVWMLYASSLGGQTKTSGFTVLGAAVLACLIVKIIPWALGVIIGFRLVAAGDSAASIGAIVLILALSGLALVFVFWNEIRKCSVQGKKALSDETEKWTVSKLAIVLTMLTIVRKVFALLLTLGTNSIMDRLLDSIIYGSAVNPYAAESLYSSFAPLFGLASENGIHAFVAMLNIAVSICAICVFLQIGTGQTTGTTEDEEKAD